MEDWLEVLKKCLIVQIGTYFHNRAQILLCSLIEVKTRKNLKLRSELPMNNVVLYNYSLSMQLCHWFPNGEGSSLFTFTLKIFLLRNDGYSRVHISYVCFYSSERFYVYMALPWRSRFRTFPAYIYFSLHHSCYKVLG